MTEIHLIIEQLPNSAVVTACGDTLPGFGIGLASLFTAHTTCPQCLGDPPPRKKLKRVVRA